MSFRWEVTFWSAVMLASVSVLAVSLRPSNKISVTFELDDGHLLTFDGDKDKCIMARNALESDDGSTVSTQSPWGVKYMVKHVWCVTGGRLIAEGSL